MKYLSNRCFISHPMDGEWEEQGRSLWTFLVRSENRDGRSVRKFRFGPPSAPEHSRDGTPSGFGESPLSAGNRLRSVAVIEGNSTYKPIPPNQSSAEKEEQGQKTI